MTEPENTNELSVARKTIESVIVHYVNAGFAAGLTAPDWESLLSIRVLQSYYRKPE